MNMQFFSRLRNSRTRNARPYMWRLGFIFHLHIVGAGIARPQNSRFCNRLKQYFQKTIDKSNFCVIIELNSKIKAEGFPSTFVQQRLLISVAGLRTTVLWWGASFFFCPQCYVYRAQCFFDGVADIIPYSTCNYAYHELKKTNSHK